MAIAMVFSSCAPRVMFTEGARKKLEEAKVDLSLIQFYNDKEILLQRKMDNNEVVVESGTIREHDGRRIQEVRIPRYTPAIYDGFENGKLVVRFELGDGKTLRFYRNSYDKFQIDADKWVKRNGMITYGNMPFLIKPIGNDALLLVKKTKVYKTVTESETAKGLNVNKRR